MLDTQKSPLTSPPPTEFPYPADTQGQSDCKVDGSETTLASPQISQDRVQLQPIRSASGATSHRPRFHAQKFATERPYLGPPLDPELVVTRRATGTPAHERGLWNDEESDTSSLSSSESESSDDEISPSPLGLRQLNSAKRVERTNSSQKFRIGNEQFKSKGRVSRTDGRLKISVRETAQNGYLGKALDATIRHHLRSPPRDVKQDTKPEKAAKHADLPPPKLNVLIAIIGSRGDIQPFIRIAQILRNKHGHRVRFATHPVFRKFVEDECGLEFFSLGGDPSELMAFMVKNPGLIPSIDTVKKGEIGRRRDQMLEMFEGFWRACINAADDEKNISNLKMLGSGYPFAADAIISNPPLFAHYHCAERLAIPLHLMFTFPYSPTQAFPHPLANIKRADIDPRYANFMSYPLVELMTWQGLGDLVNDFRRKTLGLEEVSTLWAPGQLSRQRVPYTYLWSPGLVPKPDDWGPEINIAGYVFLDLASTYQPSEPLAKFLEAGDVIYIGFGSISGIDDPQAFTEMIFEATRIAGVRAVVSKGWGGVGGENVPENVFMIDNVPHDWLFPKMKAVVHHGGAGTTAAGLRYGQPTLIVPFFGDQPFWAQMVARAGAGASQPIPYKSLSAEKLAEGILECLTPEAKEKAQKIAQSIDQEGDGAQNAVDAFHNSLPLTGENSIRCDIFPENCAVWKIKKTDLKLSALAADLLIDMKRCNWSDLELLRMFEWADFQGPGEPITGASGAVVASLAEAISGVSKIPFQTRKDINNHKKAKQRRTYKHIGVGAAIPGKIAQEKIKQRLPNGGHIEELGSAVPRLNLTPTSSSSPDLSNVPNSRRSKRSRSLPATVFKSTAHGVGESAKALANLPVNFGYALTRGFHNAPRLYGDDTVRQSHAIRGFRTSMTATEEEVRYGIADGVSGLVKLPYHDVKRDGPIGIVTGVAKGIGGLVLKPITGLLAIPTYLSKGIQMEIQKRARDTGKAERFIRRARMVEGALEARALTMKSSKTSQQASPDPGEVRRQAAQRWKEIQRLGTLHESQGR